MENKIRAIRKPNKYSQWFAVIECGKWKMIPASCDFFTRKEDGMVFRYHRAILNPPPHLLQWDEISTKPSNCCEVVELDKREDSFEGWEECENNTIKLLYELGEFAGIPRSTVDDFITKTK